jgi:hypothetical protein
MKKHLRVFLPLLVLAVLGAALFIAAPLKADESTDFLAAEESIPEEALNDSPSRTPDAFDQIEQALAGKEISLRDAVLLKAKLLFDPQAVASDNRSRVLAGHTNINEPCLTGFYKDVHRVFNQLSNEEKEYLGSLSEDLKVIVSVKERESAQTQTKTGASVSALPVYANLTKKIEGTNCTVNYTDTVGDPDVTTKKYAELVKVYIEMAYTAETKKFRAALAEAGGTGDKLQVYVLNMAAGTWGEWVDVSTVAGKQKSGYIKISRNIETEAGRATWQKQLKGTCYHEYFHGVQSAYNWASSLWFMEGTCRWAETYYGGNWDALKNTFAAGDSVFNKPFWPIWWNTFHKYSTVTLAYYFADKYGNDDFILSYFKATEGEDDAIKVLTSLVAGKGAVFGDEFKNFWIAMYTKNIKSIKKYMPAVYKQTGKTYGLTGTATTYQLGALFHVLTPQSGLSKTSLIFNYLPTAATVEAFRFDTKTKTKTDIDPATAGDANYRYVANFGSSVKEVIIVYTDVTYAAQDAAAKTATFRYLQPYIKITKVTVNPPVIPQYSHSSIPFTYDLLGTVPGETFSTQVKVTEKGASESVSGEYAFPVGKSKTFQTYFNSGDLNPGTYAYAVDFLVPGDSWKTEWGTPQVKSSAKFSVKVVKASATASKKNKGNTQTNFTTSPAD